MKPYLVDEVRAPDLDGARETEPEELHQAMSPATSPRADHR